MSAAVANRPAGVRGAPRLWWDRLPALVARTSPALGSGLTDGIHLVRWPLLAGLAPPAAFGAGAGLAWLQGAPAFTSSLLLVVVLAAVGLTSLQLGVWTWLGYTAVEVGTGGQDVVTFGSALERWAGTPLATLTHAVLLAMLLIGVPFVVLATRVELRWLGWSRRLGPNGEALAALCAAAGALYLWAQAMVVLIRPVFTLQGTLPTTDAVAPLQQRWPLLVGAGLLAMAVRLVVERRAHSPRVTATVAAVAARLARTAGTRRPPAAVARLLPAAVSTLLLTSLVSSWWQAAVTFAVLLGLSWVRDRIRTSGRLRLLAAVPLLVRLALAVVASGAIIRLALGFVVDAYGLWGSSGFTVPWLAVLACAAVVAVLTAPSVGPGTAGPPEDAGTPGAEPGAAGPDGARP